MTRFIKMTLLVDETAVGGLMADLTDRVKRIDYEVVVLKDGRGAPKGRAEDLLKFMTFKGTRPVDLAKSANISYSAVTTRLTKLLEQKLIQKNGHLYSLRKGTKP